MFKIKDELHNAKVAIDWDRKKINPDTLEKIDWLIEQVERIEDLENDRNGWEKACRAVLELYKTHERKCAVYRAVLEKISDITAKDENKNAEIFGMIDILRVDEEWEY